MVRTRFAPSPTGSLHMGGARTALYNYLLAKHHGGTFVLRIEDTDKARNTQASREQLISELKWLGLTWDEGPTASGDDIGDFGPYSQSSRFDIYTNYAQKLLETGHAFYCFASEEDIELQRQQTPERHTFKFQSPYRDWTLAQADAELAKGTPAVIRFKNTHEADVFHLQDLVRGDIQLPGHMIGDFVILRNDGSPVYNFCCAIDDALMKITHVLRGEEHLPNTLRQMMIFEALNIHQPVYGHLSLILDQDGKKLSKRSGASSISDFMDLGYVPEGLLNYLALLGWSDPDHREILSIKQMIAAFSTDRLNPAAPMYDPDKLRWVNFKHLHSYPHDKLWSLSQPFIQKAALDLPKEPSWHTQAIDFFSQDFHTLADSATIFKPFTLQPPIMSPNGLDILSWPDSQKVIGLFLLKLYEHCGLADREQVFCRHLCKLLDIPVISGLTHIASATIANSNTSTILDSLCADLPSIADDIPALDVSNYEMITKSVQADLQVKGKSLFKPLRVAMTACADGPDLKLVIQLVAIARLILRVEYAYCCCFLVAKNNV